VEALVIEEVVAVGQEASVEAVVIVVVLSPEVVETEEAHSVEEEVDLTEEHQEGLLEVVEIKAQEEEEISEAQTEAEGELLAVAVEV
jgi:hypothetical protein